MSSADFTCINPLVMDATELTKAISSQLSNEDASQRAQSDSPSYWTSDAETLRSSSNIGDISFGTGHSIYSSKISPIIEQACHEVILVTCFWAQSETSSVLNDSLRKLAAKATEMGKLIRVRVYFSSSSLFQKLFHSPSLKGKIYSPSSWQSTFGLPSADELTGLDLQIKSIFVLPFSVMHPKFIIIDRQRVLLLSCNVSWEDWFEGCMDLGGPIVDQFVRFFQEFWAEEPDSRPPPYTMTSKADPVDGQQFSPISPLAVRRVDMSGVPSVLLPSPHHWNPQIRMPWQRSSKPPSTPLNICLLGLFAKASDNVFIQTPNITAQPVLDALLSALSRGVNIRIVTSEKLMVLEQLVTAGTTNKRCMQWLISQHRQLLNRHRSASASPGRLESGMIGNDAGTLRIEYYRPRAGEGRAPSEPVQSHLKLTIVDDRIAVHGSGNMDRASWYTSQELDVAFISSELVSSIKGGLAQAMQGRSEILYDNSGQH
ncbi:hypothetical protein D0869_03372 [Hortaea werneckii]|uniref:PLD phosphodiesterase domain-containing protein n=1 Tax=Hortaea werneckii TaxID=91943 RepID=A0A3M6X5H3_HORWE|nr:hypothetical protein D0869_03372 [Hortaea werneckii]